MVTCYVGKPIEFKATYDWTPYHEKTMLHFDWLGAPSVAIGSGFSVTPKLMNIDPTFGVKIPVYKSPTLPCDLHLIVQGPGLPPGGKEAALDWVQAPCLGVTGKTYCRQFLPTATVTAFDAGINYFVDFTSGFTSQEFGKDTGNIASWQVCVDGPYGFAMVANLHKHTPYEYEWWRKSPQSLKSWGVQYLEAIADSPAELSTLSLRPSIEEISETIRDLETATVSADLAPFLQEWHDALVEIRRALTEAERLVRRGAEMTDTDERHRLVEQASAQMEGTAPSRDRLLRAYAAYDKGLRRIRRPVDRA